jgi:hypothetical protein
LRTGCDKGRRTVWGENIPILVLLHQQHHLSLLTITIPVMATPPIQAKSLSLVKKGNRVYIPKLKETVCHRED